MKWLKTVSSSYNHSLSLDATIMVSNKSPIFGEHVAMLSVTQWVTIAIIALPAKNTLDYSFRDF